MCVHTSVYMSVVSPVLSLCVTVFVADKYELVLEKIKIKKWKMTCPNLPEKNGRCQDQKLTKISVSEDCTLCHVSLRVNVMPDVHSCQSMTYGTHSLNRRRLDTYTQLHGEVREGAQFLRDITV